MKDIDKLEQVARSHNTFVLSRELAKAIRAFANFNVTVRTFEYLQWKGLKGETK